MSNLTRNERLKKPAGALTKVKKRATALSAIAKNHLLLPTDSSIQRDDETVKIVTREHADRSTSSERHL